MALFGTALIALIVSPLPRLWKPLRGWSPDKLSSVEIGLLDGHEPGSYAGPAAVALMITGTLLGLSVWRIGRREMRGGGRAFPGRAQASSSPGSTGATPVIRCSG
ncbi:hypothetical protein ACU686_19440 [Yinghuangia aomiensis]